MGAELGYALKRHAAHENVQYFKGSMATRYGNVKNVVLGHLRSGLAHRVANRCGRCKSGVCCGVFAEQQRSHPVPEFWKNKYQTCLSNDLYFQMKLCQNGLTCSQMMAKRLQHHLVISMRSHLLLLKPYVSYRALQSQPSHPI